MNVGPCMLKLHQCSQPLQSRAHSDQHVRVIPDGEVASTYFEGRCLCRHRWLTRSWHGRERRGVKGIERVYRMIGELEI